MKSLVRWVADQESPRPFSRGQTVIVLAGSGVEDRRQLLYLADEVIQGGERVWLVATLHSVLLGIGNCGAKHRRLMLCVLQKERGAELVQRPVKDGRQVNAARFGNHDIVLVNIERHSESDMLHFFALASTLRHLPASLKK